MLYLRAPDGRIFDTTTALPQTGLPRSDVSTPEVEVAMRSRARAEFPDSTPPDSPNIARHPKPVRVLPHRKAVLAVVFSPDSRWLATDCSDNTVRIWDIANGTNGLEHLRVRRNGWLPFVASVNRLAFSPDGRCLAIACTDNTARVWDVTGRRERLSLTVRHKGWLSLIHPIDSLVHPVNGVAFSPDGRWFGHRKLGQDRVDMGVGRGQRR